MRGATGDLGDAVVLEAQDLLRLVVADGAAVALLTMLVVSPGIHLPKKNSQRDFTKIP